MGFRQKVCTYFTAINTDAVRKKESEEKRRKNFSLLARVESEKQKEKRQQKRERKSRNASQIRYVSGYKPLKKGTRS